MPNLNSIDFRIVCLVILRLSKLLLYEFGFFVYRTFSRGLLGVVKPPSNTNWKVMSTTLGSSHRPKIGSLAYKKHVKQGQIKIGMSLAPALQPWALIYQQSPFMLSKVRFNKLFTSWWQKEGPGKQTIDYQKQSHHTKQLENSLDLKCVCSTSLDATFNIH